MSKHTSKLEERRISKIEESPLSKLIHDFVKNAHQMTEKAQNAVAEYISWQSRPQITMSIPDNESVEWRSENE